MNNISHSNIFQTLLLHEIFYKNARLLLNPKQCGTTCKRSGCQWESGNFRIQERERKGQTTVPAKMGRHASF